MSDSVDLEAAALQARAARARLSGTVHELRSRLTPARLLDEAVEAARTGASGLAQTTVDAAVRRPRVALVVAGAAALLLVRRLVRRRRRRARETD